MAGENGSGETMLRPRRSFLLVLLMLFGGAGFASGSLFAQVTGLPRAVVADWTLLPDGTLKQGHAVLLAPDGTIERIVAVSDGSLPEPRWEGGPGSVITPGLHELLTELGAAGENYETFQPIDPEASMAAALDPMRRDLEAARRAGVLHATSAPSPANPVSGRALTIATGSRTRLELIGDPSRARPLVCSVGESALDPNREPTSRSGLRMVLERWLADSGRTLLADDARRRGAPPLVHCGEAMDVRLAVELFSDRMPTLVLASGARDAARLLARSGGGGGTPLVVGPFRASTSIPELRAIPQLVAAGYELAFHGAMPGGGEHSLRATARRAVREGLDPAVARRAMTSTPARVAGVADQIGSLAPGLRADLVVFSGDPLLASSRVLAVWQRGRRVSIDPPAATPSALEPNRNGRN